MKTEAIRLVKNVVKTNVSRKAEKAISSSIKDGAEMVSKSQDAMAAQGESMVKRKYTKPEQRIIKIETESNLMVGSNNGNNHGYTGGGTTGGGGEEGVPGFTRPSSLWDHGFDNGGSGIWKD